MIKIPTPTIRYVFDIQFAPISYNIPKANTTAAPAIPPLTALTLRPLAAFVPVDFAAELVLELDPDPDPDSVAPAATGVVYVVPYIVP